MKADLHLHTQASDGLLTPEELVKQCEQVGLTCISVTDHDTMQGSSQARTCLPPGMLLIRGVELSLKDMRGLHLLAYGFEDAPLIQEKLEQLAAARMRRAERMLQKLAALGISLDAEALYQGVSGTIGRLHIAEAMIQQGSVRSVSEAFSRYIGEDGPAYVSAERLSMAEALTLVRSAGYIPVLAHPRELNLPDYQLRSLLEKWKELGLMGLEVYHPSALRQGFDGLLRLARELSLMVTGGSDFHGQGDHHGEPGCMAAWWKTMEEDVQKLLSFR